MSFNQQVILTSEGVDEQKTAPIFGRYEETTDNSITYSAQQFVNCIVTRSTSAYQTSDTTPSAAEIIEFMSLNHENQIGSSFETLMWRENQDSFTLHAAAGVTFVAPVYNGGTEQFFGGDKNQVIRMIGIITSSDTVDIYSGRKFAIQHSLVKYHKIIFFIIKI